ncbi:hypothetical protein BFJ65_g18738 [Fusarium oxysporum f. sp. cepae]|uniref:Uncharacterized protein n=1 Tax=Fusarium oxysporum f. sp. cepae TaxID=396571 RepID=A0A3L6MRD9_FUSOX|nr:hypothetical protein BFJ65_g18738 [Fusarium oxysporum f. sp. cepae]RKK17233.1 hypothetical protein BFJ67_g17772 [Fusarium oxysporum f. sp. cepae]
MVNSVSCYTAETATNILFEQKKKKQKKKAPPIGSARDFPCRPCVTRATKSPGYECASQDNTGAACWACAKNGHTCRPVPPGAVAAVRAFWELNRQIDDMNEDPGDAWRSAAQRAAQQLRACSAAPAPALAPRGEADGKTLEERKVAALEAIAEAARLWTQLNKLDEESVEEDEDGEDEGN